MVVSVIWKLPILLLLCVSVNGYYNYYGSTGSYDDNGYGSGYAAGLASLGRTDNGYEYAGTTAGLAATGPTTNNNDYGSDHAAGTTAGIAATGPTSNDNGYGSGYAGTTAGLTSPVTVDGNDNTPVDGAVGDNNDDGSADDSDDVRPTTSLAQSQTKSVIDNNVTTDLLTIILVIFGVILALGVIFLVSGLLFCKYNNKNKVKIVNKKTKKMTKLLEKPSLKISDLPPWPVLKKLPPVNAPLQAVPFKADLDLCDA